jgi:glutamate dehydrogenase (NADP+)
MMRFCQSFMTELSKYIGPNTDVPAGDIGVNGQVIGYLYGQYKKIRNEFTGVLTGKPFVFGGSNIRPEATGYGLVYFTQNLLQGRMSDSIVGKRVAVSGAGNVAQFAVEKLIELGAVPVTMSDSGGTIHEPDGITLESLCQIMHIKGNKGSLRKYQPSPKGVHLWLLVQRLFAPYASPLVVSLQIVAPSRSTAVFAAHRRWKWSALQMFEFAKSAVSLGVT